MIILSERAKIEIESSPPDMRNRFDKLLDMLQKDPRQRFGHMKLKGEDNVWAIRINETVRLLYTIDGENIIVTDILDHQRYKK